MITISKSIIIITGNKDFCAKISKKDLPKGTPPNYILIKYNGKYNYNKYRGNEDYDIKLGLEKTINCLSLYAKYEDRTVSLGRKFIFYINSNIPLSMRFWETKNVLLKPQSLCIFTSNRMAEIRFKWKKDTLIKNSSILITVGKTNKHCRIKDNQNSIINFNIGRGIKIARFYITRKNQKKIFLGFRLFIRSNSSTDSRLHPSRYNSYSKWHQLYSETESSLAISKHKSTYAVIINACDCNNDQVSTCLESYSKQNCKNFHVFIFSKCNEIKRHFYDFKIKYIHCNSDFQKEWQRMEKTSLNKYSYTFFTDARTNIPNDFFFGINIKLENIRYDFLYFDSVYWNGNDLSYEFRNKFDYVNIIQRNCIGTSYVIKTELLVKNAPLEPHSLSDIFRYFITEIPLISSEKICHSPLILHEQKRFESEYRIDNAMVDGFKSLSEQNLQFRENLGAVNLEPKLPRQLPLISLVVPSAGKLKYLLPFLDSLSKRTDYKKFELILTIEEDNYRRVKSQLVLDKMQLPKTVLVQHKFKVFNYSKIINNALKHCTGKYICLLNDDLEFTNPAWLSEMLRWLYYRNTGIVGALLLYPDRKIQHAGITLGINGVCEHAEQGFNSLRCQKTNRLAKYPRSVTAVTGACLLAPKSTFDKLNGLDEKFAEAYNDVDFCLRARAIDHNIVLSAKSKIYHHESVNVGHPLSKERISTFQKEISFFLERHAEEAKKDEYYSVNLSKEIPYSEFAYPPANGFYWRKNIPCVAPERTPVSEWKTNIALDLEKVCVFSHFDPDNLIDDHVVDYLEAIRKCGWSIIFVTSCGTLNRNERNKLSQSVSIVIGTRGEGRDWGNYSIGYARCKRFGTIKNLLLANDSVYGPIGELYGFFEFSKKTKADMVGMTNSLQYGNHLQSYFILCKENLCSHKLFEHFWNTFYYQSEKDEIIYKNEIGFSQFFTRYGFVIEAYHDYESLKAETIRNKSFGYKLLEKGLHVNPTHHFIQLLLDKYDSPFVKIELLKFNPSKIKDLDKIRKAIGLKNKVLSLQIKKHLKRCS